MRYPTLAKRSASWRACWNLPEMTKTLSGLSNEENKQYLAEFLSGLKNPSKRTEAAEQEWNKHRLKINHHPHFLYSTLVGAALPFLSSFVRENGAGAWLFSSVLGGVIGFVAHRLVICDAIDRHHGSFQHKWEKSQRLDFVDGLEKLTAKHPSIRTDMDEHLAKARNEMLKSIKITRWTARP